MAGLTAITVVSPADPQVRALIERHHAHMLSTTPPEFAFALDLAAFENPAITLLGAWAGESLAGIGALYELTPEHGELKAMRTSDRHLRQGVARGVLDALLELARSRGYARVSLETGTGAEFAPAVALYAATGFASCGPFADYAPSPHNQFMTLAL